MKIGILGSGDVAKALGHGLRQLGHAVMLGSRTPSRLDGWAKDQPGTRLGSFADAAAFGDLLVLAVKGHAALAVLQGLPAEALAGKTVIDTCNPIAETPPVNGVLPFFGDVNDSLLEQLQRASPQAHFVKAFNSVGAGLMVQPKLDGGPPTMFICGTDEAAKRSVSELSAALGWNTADMGGVESARAIEPLCRLWCIPGIRDNRWQHAFALLRAD